MKSRKRKSCRDDGLNELRKDIEVGTDVISRASNSSWWLWDGGSTILYWRWPAVYRKSARDGTLLFIEHGKFPRYTEGQRDCKDDDIQSKVMKKVDGLGLKGYISPGLVKSITLFFHVLKGKDDIRMVFDATKCELNCNVHFSYNDYGIIIRGQCSSGGIRQVIGQVSEASEHLTLSQCIKRYG